MLLARSFNLLISKGLIATLIISGLILLFISVTIINLKIKKPEGCEDVDSNCSLCGVQGCKERKEEKNE